MFRKLFVALALVACALPVVAGEKSRLQLTSELFALIDQADEMVVYSEGFKREFVVYRSSSRKDFEQLKSAITLKRTGGPFQCACMDGPEIALLKNKKEIATVWNHEGTAIGSSVWNGDWYNGDADRWLRWFDARGMTGAREFFNQVHREEIRAKEDERRWLKTMPSSLKPLWSNAVSQYQPPGKYPNLEPLNLALAKQYADISGRIRALMAWYGSGAGPWSGFPGYEEIAEKLLRQYPAKVLIEAVESRNLTDQELEGAARIFGGWTPVRDSTPIPADLRHALLEHCLKSSDQDKVERAQRAFASEK
ncbi:MAG: hypothetical protein LAO18_00475 [Acidobacteriia bacterium]|nr:hypothetical protein [Terriglobia bacterium]